MDITTMWAHEAARLVSRLHHYWQVIPGTDPPWFLSSVAAHMRAVEAERIATVDELRDMGLKVTEV